MRDNMWTWLSGNDSAYALAVYGTKNIPCKECFPGAREGAVGWFDSLNEEFWLFGGYGRSAKNQGI